MNHKNKHQLRQNKKENKMSLPRKIVLLFFIICFCVSAYQIAKWKIETSKTSDEYKELVKEVVVVDEDTENQIQIDFSKLKEKNSDTVGWIKINETSIDYPIVQAGNNEYYLKRNYYKESSVSGAIFADYRNKSNLTDKNIILYGHNMKDGSMFAGLTDIYQGKIGKDVTITIYTEKKHLEFKVFSCYNTEPDEYSLNTEISQENYDEFLNNLKNRSERNFDVEPRGSNQSITLSTCSSNGKNRIIVHGCLKGVNW